LGTTDFSSYLIKAKAAKPDVLMLLPAGDDLVNVIKQTVQFGIDKQIHIAGGLMELEVLQALPDSARIGLWTFEWYWNQPGVPENTKNHIATFVKTYQGKFGDTPSARSWFGLASVYAMALGIAKAKTLDLPKVARAIEGLVLPPEVALQPGDCFYRPGDHQMIANAFPGSALQGTQYPNLVELSGIVPAKDVVLPVDETGCKMVRPTT
jgi:branched-chain amino acid transport system substrate-binding protein